MSQRGRPVGRLQRRINEAVDLAQPPCRNPSADDLEPADDAGQHVVEVVRDTTGENAQGLELVHPLQLLLEACCPRDVDAGRDEPDDVPFRVPEQGVMPGDHSFLA